MFHCANRPQFIHLFHIEKYLISGFIIVNIAIKIIFYISWLSLMQDFLWRIFLELGIFWVARIAGSWVMWTLNLRRWYQTLFRFILPPTVYKRSSRCTLFSTLDIFRLTIFVNWMDVYSCLMILISIFLITSEKHFFLMFIGHLSFLFWNSCSCVWPHFLVV